jgi:prepilin-type N-terminal cleavage/methylation domain-containing protein
MIRWVMRPESSGSDDGQKGFSLVELLVAMAVMLIVGSVVVSGLVSGLRATERGQARVEALTDLGRASERLARDLRFADPVDAASPSQVIANVLHEVGGVLERHRVTLAVTAGTITETRAVYRPSTAATPTTTTTSTVIDGLDPGVAVFAFAKADGQPWVSGTDPVDDLAEITLELTRQLPNQDPITVQTSVFVRNVEDGR